MSRRDFSESVIARVDKDRRTDSARLEDCRVTAEGRMAVVAMILKQPAHRRVSYMDGVLHGVRDQMTVSLDAAGASSRIAASAQQAIITGPNARARAVQLFTQHEGPDAP